MPSSSLPLLTWLALTLTLSVTIVGGSVASLNEVTKHALRKKATSCFPAIGFTPPKTLPIDADIHNWWCDSSTEYAFVGFSYEVTACQSLSQLRQEFLDIRKTFNGRYVRLYGACDRAGFYDDVVDAAWVAGVGVHALIWFGFDGDDAIWKRRRDSLFLTLRYNPRAPYVTRTVQFGSEPLFDNAISHGELASQVKAARAFLAPLGISVTVSELAYGFQVRGGAQDVLDAVDSVHAHILPFFAQTASTGSSAWPLVLADISWFASRSKGKKIYFSQNGWPSVTSQGVKPNSPMAVANVKNEQDYYSMLDSHCAELKARGIAWFAHIYSDLQEPGYGVYDYSLRPKFNFRPRIAC